MTIEIKHSRHLEVELKDKVKEIFRKGEQKSKTWEK